MLLKTLINYLPQTDRPTFKKFAYFLLLFVSILSSCQMDSKSLTKDGTIRLESGLISGILLDSAIQLKAYKGIPYAKPPVRELRWQPPQLVEKWEGVLTCDQNGASCPQIDYGGTLDNMNEDCLCLNVWSTHEGEEELLPVMVWIHGGGLNEK